jgi:toxin FitB
MSFLIDTDVLSDLRKPIPNAGVLRFLRQHSDINSVLYLSAITVGELRRGIEKARHRGDKPFATRLEVWLKKILAQFAGQVLPFEQDAAQVWGLLLVPDETNPIDKQIAATALVYDLTVVTRNIKHFAPTGVKLHNPFS